MGIKIIFAVFILFVLSRTVIRYRKKHIGTRELFGWMFFWILVGIAALSPQTTDLLAAKVGVGRGLDLLLAVSVAVLFYIMFRILIKLHSIERDITKIARDIAMNREKKNE